MCADPLKKCGLRLMGPHVFWLVQGNPCSRGLCIALSPWIITISPEGTAGGLRVQWLPLDAPRPASLQQCPRSRATADNTEVVAQPCAVLPTCRLLQWGGAAVAGQGSCAPGRTVHAFPFHLWPWEGLSFLQWTEVRWGPAPPQSQH